MEDVDRFVEFGDIKDPMLLPDMDTQFADTSSDVRHRPEIPRRLALLDEPEIMSGFAPSLRWKPSQRRL